MDCCNMAVSGDGYTYFHVCILYPECCEGGSCLQGCVDFRGGEKVFDQLLGHLFNSKKNNNKKPIWALIN